MPHLPDIEITGGSVSISYGAREGNEERIKKNGEMVHNPNSPPEKRVTIHQFADVDPDSKIYLIEIQGTAGSPRRYFVPNAEGKCSIKISYLSGAEVAAKERPQLPPKLTELG